jgi:hypothetical protein
LLALLVILEVLRLLELQILFPDNSRRYCKLIVAVGLVFLAVLHYEFGMLLAEIDTATVKFANFVVAS